MKFFLLIALLFALPVQAKDKVGNGGDPIALEVISIGKAISDFIHTPEGQAILPEMNAEKFEKILSAVEIEVSTDQLIDKNGEVKAALNFPREIKIVIQKTRWLEMRKQPNLKVSFALHEFLGLMELEIDHYRLSSKISNLSLWNEPPYSMLCSFKTMETKLKKKFLSKEEDLLEAHFRSLDPFGDLGPGFRVDLDRTEPQRFIFTTEFNDSRYTDYDFSFEFNGNFKTGTFKLTHDHKPWSEFAFVPSEGVSHVEKMQREFFRYKRTRIVFLDLIVHCTPTY